MRTERYVVSTSEGVSFAGRNECEAAVFDTARNHAVVSRFVRQTLKSSPKVVRQYVYVQARAVADELNRLHSEWSDRAA